MDDGIPNELLPGRGPWATLAWALSSVVLVILVVGMWLRLDGESGGVNLSNAIIDGNRPVAPALPMEPVVEGDHTRVLSGHVVVVNWWASWCQPCVEEAPVLAKIAGEYEGRVTVVGLNAGAQDMSSDARAFAREHELDFVLLRGNRSDEEVWGRPYFPETYVIGSDGRVSSYVAGPVDEETLSGLLDAELAERRTATPRA